MTSKESKKPIILIVDDEPTNIQLLGNLLKKLDCELAAARNGQLALETVKRIKPDLILLDVMMPDLDGHEVFRQLKKYEETKEIPVIFLTAKNETEDVITGFELGAADYVTKPFIKSELLARVKTQLSLKKAKEDLQEEVTTKKKFFSIISHDLRGSVGIVLSLSQILQENQESFSKEEIDELLQDIGKTSHNALALLENLLEWVRSKSGNVNYKPEKLKINDLISVTLRTLGDEAQKKGIKLNFNSSGNELVLADMNMVLLILRNLVSNAIKFTPKEGKVEVYTEENEEFVKILISDTGVGMKQETINKLFHIESKISTEGTEKEQGNGLGLILCKEFVEINRGKIKIESEEGKGTTAWFTLPKQAKV